MKIDINFINKIFNLKIKLKKREDKIKLSQYEEQIPMYDIYSQTIYPISKLNIHYRLVEYHYRFINEEVNQWLINLYDKYNKIDDKESQKIAKKLKYNLDVISNYDIEILKETSYKTLYKYSPNLGLLVSICKRNSFHPFIQHLKPYYTKLELIKLGQNMNVVESKIELEYLVDHEIHYNVCKTVSKNDVSFEEIRSHHEFIIENNIKSWICFYSFTGSFLFNKYLRNFNVNAIRGINRSVNIDNNINPILLSGLIDIVKKMEISPELKNVYDMYRFIWDDTFLMGLKEGDIFMDKGFISSTRDPFYSPGLNGNFGLILLKIKIPKNKKGIGLFIENFSVFPKEEEYLLPPFSKLKLISKNENFKYSHINSEFEKLINRKYEFELVEIDYQQFYKNIKPPISLKNKHFHSIENIQIYGNDRYEIIKNFIQQYGTIYNNEINIKLKNKSYSFLFQWFDSSINSSYEKFFYNKIKEGMLFSLFDSSGYPYLNIEFGNQMVINYLNSIYYISNEHENLNLNIDNDILDLLSYLGKILNYKTCIIYHKFSSFNKFSNNYTNSDKLFLSMNLFNETLYLYAKNNIKYLDFNPFINYNLGYWYLDDFFNKEPDNLPNELKNITNNKELFIQIIEKYFYFYPKFIQQIDKNILKNLYVIFNIYDKLVADGITDTFKPILDYNNENIPDDNFKLIFRQPIRRL